MVLVASEIVDNMEIKLLSVDDLWVRTTYGTHYVIATDTTTGRMRAQQVFQDGAKARKYYEYFVDFYSRRKGIMMQKHPGVKDEHLRNVVEAGRLDRDYTNPTIRSYVSKAPWWYNMTRI